MTKDKFRAQEQSAYRQQFSPELLTLLVENTRDVIYRYRFSPTPDLEYVSPAIFPVTGYTPQECYADPTLGPGSIYPADRPDFEKHLQDGGALGQPFTTRWLHKDGTVIWMEQRHVPVYDEQGRLVGLEGIARERVEPVLGARPQQESNSLYNSLFENNHAAMLLIDPGTGDIVDGNPAACSYYGYNRAELVLKKITDINLLAAEQVFGALQRAYLGQQRRFNFQHRLANGETRDVETYSGPITVAGRPLLYSIVHDITARKEAQEALRKSEERFRQVVVSISAHIYVTEVMADDRLVNLYISPHVEALTGYPRQKFETDWSFWPLTVIHPDDRAAAAVQAKHLAIGHNSEVEYRLLRADGRVLWVRDSARVESEGDSRIIYGLVSDITERKRTEEEVRKLNEELERRVLDRTRELSALYDVTAVASEALDLKTTLKRSLERVLAAMRSQMGAVYLLDETEQALRLVAQQGISPELVANISTTPPGIGLAGWVVDNGEPLLVPDLTADARAPTGAQEHGIHTYIGAPMRARGQTLGALSVFGQVEQQYTLEEVALLASIADQVGVAVENARLRKQAEQAAVMDERQRLARDLHDSVTQSLYSLALFAEAGAKVAQAEHLEPLKYHLKRIGETAHHALKEMRLLVHELRPLDLEQEGLVGALHRRLNAVEGRVNIKTRLVAEQLVKLPPVMEEGLYRISQEALNNALKHADATQVTVYLRAEGDQVELEIVDNGTGFQAEAVERGGGMGLVNMQERAAKLGGTLIVNSTPGEGTRVTVSVKTSRSLSA